MQFLRSLNRLPTSLRGGAITIGNFDGVHRGHARLIERLRQWAQRIDGPTIVFTFDPHPARILRPTDAPPPLTWAERKAELLTGLGVDALIAYPTTERLLSLTYEQFFDELVVTQLGARAIVEGPNFLFGRSRAGTVQLLSQLCEKADIALEVVEPTMEGEGLVSSSRIREAIRLGDVGAAAGMLTQPYRVRGMVTHGAGRGVALGFPTANVCAVDTLTPGPGVYAGRGIVAGVHHTAAIHVGPNPTFDDLHLKIEVHLLDFDQSLYGEPIEVVFERRIRDVERFDSVDDLKQQLAEDIATVRGWSASQSANNSADPTDS